MEKFEIVKSCQDFNQRLDKIKKIIKIDNLKNQLQEIEKKMSEPDFWLDTTQSTKILSENKIIKQKIEDYNKIANKIDELNIMIELDDDELFKTADEIIKDLEAELKKYEISLLLNGKYDSNNAIIEIHPGAGGTESQDWALMLYRMYKRYTERVGFKFELLEYQEGLEAGLKSVTFMACGKNAYGYLKGEKGVHRLIRISPFDSNARRHTSFAGVNVYPEVSDETDITINPDDLRIDTYRSSGAGGQHINTTDSAVRITHIPTGIVVSCQNERSQIQNREKAMTVLMAKLNILKAQEIDNEVKSASGDVTDNAFGNQIRTYTLHPYSLVKDHRTNLENGNPSAVLDGEIDEFIDAYLEKIKSED